MTQKTLLLLGMVLCFLIVGVTAGLSATGMAPSFLYLISAAFLAVGVILAVKGVRTSLRGQPSLNDPDGAQASYNRAFGGFPVFAVLLAAASADEFWRYKETPDDQLRFFVAACSAAGTFAVIWIYARMLTGRSSIPWFQRMIDDEFFQDNLTKARSDGFFALMSTVTLCFFIGLFSDRLAVSLLPFAVAFSVSFAGLRFIRRDLRATESMDASKH